MKRRKQIQVVHYRFPGGTVVTRREQHRNHCAIIPGWCAHVSNPITRTTAASLLREGRRSDIKPKILTFS